MCDTAIKLSVIPHGHTATAATFVIKKGDFIQLTTKDVVATAISYCHNQPMNSNRQAR